MSLQGVTVALGVSGGIAAYKSVQVCRFLTQAGAFVIPLLTDSAQKMVGKKTFDALASEPAKVDLWDDPHPSPHTDVAQRIDCMVVCPATARVLSDYRTGRSADLLIATLIATKAPVYLAPAMHTEMWEHPAVAENVEILKQRGVKIIPPGSGALAGGDVGEGRMAEPEQIFQQVVRDFSQKKDLIGCTVLVTAGGTREPLDPVRYMTNRSTGKQGHALAEEAFARGAHVILVTASLLPADPAIQTIRVDTAAQMYAACKEHAASADLFLLAAAVADFSPKQYSAEKIKKAAGIPSIELLPTVDILSFLGSSKTSVQTVLGFAAESSSLVENAQRKLKEKQADYIVANNILDENTGFAADTNAAIVLGRDDIQVEIPVSDKRTVAKAILDVVVPNHLEKKASML